jgi:hypothetical protein
MRTPWATGCVLAIAVLAGCGGGGPTPASTPQEPPFPAAGSESLARLTRASADARPQLAPSVSVLAAGPNRFGFALFDVAGKQLEAPAAVYTAAPDGTRVRGPYPARLESLRVRPPFASRTTIQDSDAARSVYVARVPFPRRGRFVTLAVTRVGGRYVASTPAAVEVGGPQPVAVGAPAPRVHTPTVASVGGDVSSIETRLPPDDMHDTDLAQVLGRRPVVIVFATPQLCQQRVCAPVVDEVAQLKAQYGDRAAFIHMEVYRGNAVEKGLRPQLAAFGLRTEPWVFTIDRRGRVAARLESAASVAEIRAAIEAALR